MASKGSPPDTPDYVGAAQATANSNKYDSYTPGGSSTWTLRTGADPDNPQPGDYIQTQTLSPQAQGIYNQNQSNDALSAQNRYGVGLAADQALKDYQGGQQGYQNAVYNKETQYYDKRFSNDQNALDAKLAAQGITPGSEAYGQAMDSFNQNKNAAYATATNDAITGGEKAQNDATARLAQLLMSARSPDLAGLPGGQGGGADLMSAMQSQFSSELGSTNAQNATAASTNTGIGSLAAMAAVYFM